MTNTNITAFRKNVFGFVDQAVTYGEVINVTTKNGNAVILSEQDYNSMLETLRAPVRAYIKCRLEQAAGRKVSKKGR